MTSITITDALQQQLIAYRRELHAYPELSMQEFETTKRISNWLQQHDITILTYPLSVGVIAEVRGEQQGPTIAIRADIDALPIEEQTDEPFRSKNAGVMHACGHDFHTSSILGTAILLQQQRHLLKGTVRFIFQPSEETAQGAEYVAKAGVLEDVEAIFGMHNKPDLPVGTIGIKAGPLMASVDRFELDIIGTGGHAGIPESTVDPIVISSQIVTAFQSIVSRNISSFDNSVLSVTKLQAGNTWNVIPEKAELEGTVRTFQATSRATIPQRMKALAEGIAASYGAKADFRWFPYLPTVYNDARFTEVLQEAARISGHQAVEADMVPAGEDFAFYQERIPGYFVWVGVDGPFGWHHPQYRLNEDAIPVAATYFANLAVSVLDQWQ
ncbi:amidohydrolase [Lysinibacillus macroides]|uniref:Hydrolase n=1 Tax=Lysinibacillus macroides TaxID=33935 RepID=A0A0M9DIW3_9BACI|nr:amidohydrolase [Lysinibacillus macroides]KOY81092.1 hydrolase [Lysinibacillus macroides]QPR68764.1 amidohydrolase [Lysinibacillus macroides]